MRALLKSLIEKAVDSDANLLTKSGHLSCGLLGDKIRDRSEGPELSGIGLVSRWPVKEWILTFIIIGHHISQDIFWDSFKEIRL